MGEERLSVLALLHTHYDMVIDRDEVIKVFLRTFNLLDGLQQTAEYRCCPRGRQLACQGLGE